MAKHNRTYHTCDLCGIEMDKPHAGGEAGSYKMTMHEDYAVAGHSIHFHELCRSCNDFVGRWISDFKEMAKDIRVAQAMKDRE